jgi:acetyl-CoA synthetase
MSGVEADYRNRIERFRWSIPPRFNIAEVCADRWAREAPDRPALLAYTPDGPLIATSFGDLKGQSDRLAAGLVSQGLQPGDRIAILLPQSAQTVVAHLAAYKLGAIAVPLAALFGTEALRFRLVASGAAAVITNAFGLAKLAALEADGGGSFAGLILCTDGASGPAGDYHRMIADARVSNFKPLETRPDNPAMMIFTSGTTGAPKGVLHGHRVLLGHLPGISYSHAGFPAAGDRFWTPSDWAWAGGLLNVLLPSLYHGVPVVFGPFRRFDPEEAFVLMEKARVKNVFLPPTAINLMGGLGEPARFDLAIRTIAAAGESLGREAFEWANSRLQLTINEFYGLTECNYVLGSSAALGVSRAGAIGKPVPGHDVAIVDPDGAPVRAGDEGQIAISRPDPSMFLEYWNDPQATRDRFRGERLMTGDMAIADDDGYVRFIGRNDDLIISSGYRIGPTEIEECLRSHASVAQAAVVGKPDAVRNQIVKAYLVLDTGTAPSPSLVDALRAHVRERLSAAECPREISFVAEIPLTTSGKVIRRHFRDLARAETGANEVI